MNWLFVIIMDDNVNPIFVIIMDDNVNRSGVKCRSISLVVRASRLHREGHAFNSRIEQLLFFASLLI